ncbi:MAG: hypothetical protein U9O89_05435 [Thermoproteota archaeon]|nr:hypothetical protein [Thermoproteota archaeon]
MVSIAPSYLYTFAALTAVSTIILCSFTTYTTTLRTVPEIGQLKNLLNHVVAKGNQLITLTITTNSTTQVSLQMPTSIGDRKYWIRLRSDSSNAWLEGRLGEMPEETMAAFSVSFPGKTSVSGSYVGGYGPAVLECYLNGSVPQLNLHYVGGGARE